MSQDPNAHLEKHLVPVLCSAVLAFLLKQGKTEVKLLLMRRATTMNGKWCQVAGSIEAGETAWQAAIREVKEETGISRTDLWSADICEQFYGSHNERIMMLPVFVSYVNSSVKVQLNREHDAYEWLGFNAARARASFPGQRKILRHIKTEYIDRMPDLLLEIDIQ
jgi:dATP pyrophosphohydrolase